MAFLALEAKWSSRGEIPSRFRFEVQFDTVVALRIVTVLGMTILV